jgi:hypothetical protein
VADRLVLRAGPARWLRAGHGLIGLLGLLSVLGAGASPVWTVGAVAALVVVHGIGVRQMNSPRARGRLHLAEDGSALLFTARSVHEARQRRGGWCSGLLCILRLEDVDSGRRFHCVLCRSLNAPDAYRRLLQRMRLQASADPARDPEPV